MSCKSYNRPYQLTNTLWICTEIYEHIWSPEIEITDPTTHNLVSNLGHFESPFDGPTHLGGA